MKLNRRYQKLKRAYAKVAAAACLFAIFAVPFASKFSNVEEVSIEPVEQARTAYSVMLGNEQIGTVEDMKSAKEALLQVRSELNEKYNVTVYADADLSFGIDTEYTGEYTQISDLKSNMYDSLVQAAYIPEDTAYTLRIDDFMVTVDSEEDIVEVLNTVKARTQGTEGFQVELIDHTESCLTQRTVNLASADVTVNEAAKVLATIDGIDTVRVTEDTVFEDGVIYVGFAEDIEVIATRNTGDNVVSVDEAVEQITKEKAEKEIYEVVPGDCLTTISEKTNIPLDELYNLNEGLTADSIIDVGDLLTITVPKPELSVIVKEEVTYQEEYYADVIYVDNNNMYQGDQNIISNGTPGYREVIAVVSYSNGEEYSREILNQTVIKEAVATVIERGTLVPPTFIKPVNSSMITSPWGGRVHPITGVWSMHTGLDWYVPSGTAVKASCGGTVTMAGWYYGLGICVEINHGNGMVTRYGHLSSAEVYVGQTVSQGQRIGLSGSTGNSTGPHLHFEVYKWGASQNPLNYVN